MQANEAPEKIYFSGQQQWSNPFIGLMQKCADTDIEYIRTDAFIEKALAYLCNKFYFNNVFYGIVSTDFNAMEEMYEDFKKYMKGE